MSVRISRSEQKRRIKEVEKLVRELAELPEPVLKKLPGDKELRLLFIETLGLKGGARKRQIKYITRYIIKNLDNKPLAGLYDFLGGLKGEKLKQKKEFHALEYFRDSLLNEAIARRKELAADQEELPELWTSAIIDEIVRELPQVDKSALQRLSAMYARTRQARHSREIFRLLRAAAELARQRDQEKKA